MSSNNQENREKKKSTDGRQMLGRKIIRTIDSILDTVLLSFFLFFLIFSIYALWDTNQIYQAGDSAQYEIYKPAAEDSVSFEELTKLNSDVLGWITVYGTHVDYPIVQAEDNDKYVNTNVMGEYSLVGSIFLDYRNKRDFSDFNSIIYGHHMDANAMFGEIGKYEDYDYFQRHKFGNMYFDGKDHGVEFFAFLEQDAYRFEFFEPALEDEEAQQKYIDLIMENAIHKRDIGVTSKDKIVLLYTCTSFSTNGRHVLVGRITDEVFEDTFAEESAIIKGLDSQKLWVWLNKIPLWVWIVIILVILLTMEIALRKLVIEKPKRKKDKGEVEDEQNSKKENE